MDIDIDSENNDGTGNTMNGNETMQVTTTTNNNFSTYEKKTTDCQQCKQTFFIDELKECTFSKIEWRKWNVRKKSNVS